VRFLVDNQLPSALANWLRERGHGAEHVLAAGLAQGKDTPVWRLAQAQGAVLITKDEDFAEWVRRGRPGPQVVWLRIGNSTKRQLFTWLEPVLPTILRQLEQGERLVEVR
jgi:predicted nuclease of predicted toxin-antitoxin system